MTPPPPPPATNPHRYSLNLPSPTLRPLQTLQPPQPSQTPPPHIITTIKPLFPQDRPSHLPSATTPFENSQLAAEKHHAQSQRNLISRSLSVQPDMSTHTHFFMPVDHDRRLTTIEETIQRPFLFHAKFGAPPNWALDIFTLPHNAIRAECVDLYNILESIQARTDNVQLSELEEFTTWWTVFDVFVIEYFDFEADILFSWVFANIKNSSTNSSVSQPILPQKPNHDALIKTSLLSMKEQLLESLMAINNTFELRRHVDSQDVFQTVLKDVNQFVPKLIEYFRLQERHLPPMLTHLYSPDAKETITKKYINYIKHGEAPHVNLAIVTRWMEKPVREKWVRTNLRGFTRLMYTRWERKCNKEHVHIPFKFHRRLLRSVRNVAASRLRRRTEFGEEIDDISYGSLASPNGSFRSLSLAFNQSKSASATPKSGRSRETSRSRGKLR